MNYHRTRNMLGSFLAIFLGITSTWYSTSAQSSNSFHSTNETVEPSISTSSDLLPLSPKLFLPLVTMNSHLDPHTDESYTLVGAGDISYCGYTGDDQTAELIKSIPGTVISMGDSSQESGTTSQYETCYNLSWGQFKSRIHPAPGNHDYGTPGAPGYYAYFGAAAGEPGKGYYSYNVGDWHIIVLNSLCSQVGGCTKDSPQGLWLEQDLKANPSQCSIAYFHYPRWSSGQHGNISSMSDFWELFYQYHLDIVLNGHDHDYERFAPMDPNGNADSQGTREFVVGTGGMTLRGFSTIQPNSEVRDFSTWGVLKLTLKSASYDWEFIPVEGGTFHDSGSDACN